MLQDNPYNRTAESQHCSCLI